MASVALKEYSEHLFISQEKNSTINRCFHTAYCAIKKRVQVFVQVADQSSPSSYMPEFFMFSRVSTLYTQQRLSVMSRTSLSA